MRSHSRTPERCWVLGALACVAIIAGCATLDEQRKAAHRSPEITSAIRAQERGKDLMTEGELQSEVMSFADRLAAMISQTAVAFESQLPTPEARLRAREMKVFTIGAAVQAAVGPNPGVALLDTVVLVTLNRMVWEEYWRPVVFGEPADLVIDTWKKLESDIWRIAATVLTQDQQQELRRLIREWRQHNPDQVAVNFIRFRDFGTSRHASPLANAERPGGLLGIGEATAAVDQMRLLSEKALFQISHMQLLASLQFELALSHLVAQPETQRALDTSSRLLVGVDRLSLAVEQVPVRAEELLYPAIGEIDRLLRTHRRAAIDQLMDRVAGERQAVVRDLASEEERLRKLLGDAREFLTVGKDLASQVDATVTKVDTLAARFGPSPAKADEGRFHIEDYGAATRELSGAAGNLRELVTSINQLLASPTWDRRLPQMMETVDRLESDVERSLNHVFLLGAALIVVFFVALLAYRYASAKVVDSSRTNRPTR